MARSRPVQASSPISSRDVAAAAQVSQSTVSRVINGRTNVRPETRERVEREMAKLGYIPNAAARSLITRRTNLLGLVISNITNGFFPEIIDAITSAALEQGYTVVVGSAGERPESQAGFLRLLAQQRVDGIILTTTVTGIADELQALVRAGLPIVLANRIPDGVAIDGVALDNAGAGRLVTEHVIGHGRHSIAYIEGRADSATGRQRRHGFERAMRDAGLRPHPTPDRHGEFTRGHGYEQTRALLAAPERPDAIVAADDTIALGCLDALAEAGVSVPGDVAVVGVDDIPAAGLRAVWLTTVSTSARRMGTRAVELLLDRIRGGAPAKARREILPARLIIRGSCGDHPEPATPLPIRRPRAAERRSALATPAGGRT